MTIAFLTVGWYFLWRPVDASLNALNSSIADLEVLAARGPDLLAHRDAAEKWLAEREENSKALKRIPEDLQVGEFEEQLTTLARECGLHRVRLQNAAPDRQNNLDSAAITLEAGGEYPALCGFLDRLHHGSRLCPVAGLKVIKPAPEARQLEIELVLRIFAAPIETAQAEGPRHE